MANELATVNLAFFNAKVFTLKAVDTSQTFPVEYNEPGNSIVFKLDGTIYAAIENPSDGYRSHMDRILILPKRTKLATPLVVPSKVFARHSTRGHYSGESDVVEFIDMATGKIVMRIGTENTDDYYPHFVGEFDPLALAANQPDTVQSWPSAANPQRLNRNTCARSALA